MQTTDFVGETVGALVHHTQIYIKTLLYVNERKTLSQSKAEQHEVGW